MDPREAALALLAARSEDATVCPSEVARVVAAEGGAWREAMPQVHAAVDQMVGDGLVRLSWKGHPLATRAGPIGSVAADRRDPVTGTDWLQFLSRYMWVGVLFLVSGLVVVAVTVLVERCRARRRKDDQ